MKLLRSLCMALTMYSRIPAPHVAWKEENMAYAMGFFPLIGVFIGLFLWGWARLCALLGAGDMLFAAGATLLPLLITGGIHMDGFCDTADALYSRAPREKKLEILKDSRCGVGAVMSCGAYLLLAFALWTEAPRQGGPWEVLLAAPVLSRALSALAVVTFRAAKKDGLLVSFQSAAQTKGVRLASAVWIAFTATWMLWQAPLAGGLALLGAATTFLCYRVIAYRQFGGTTGDIAGWFVETSELVMLGMVCLARWMEGWLA